MGTGTVLSRRSVARAGVALLAAATGFIGVPAHADPDPITGTSTEFALADVVMLNTASAATRTTTIPVRAGHEYALEMVGSYSYGKGQADGECSTGIGDNVFRPWRYVGINGDFDNDPLDVYVNGRPVDWHPLSASGHCDPTTHQYEYLFTPTTTGVVSFYVHDFYYGDNVGTITVGVFNLGGVIEAGTRLIPPLPPGP